MLLLKTTRGLSTKDEVKWIIRFRCCRWTCVKTGGGSKIGKGKLVEGEGRKRLKTKEDLNECSDTFIGLEQKGSELRSWKA